MDRIKSIQIPRPCGQSWQQMTVNNDGRHCRHCCKAVVDFTRMTNSEIIAYISGKEHVCGRFDNHQVNNLNYFIGVQNEKRFSWKGVIAGLSLLITLPALRSEAKAKHITEQTLSKFKNVQHEIQGDTTQNVVVKGNVVAKEDGLPIPGAMIRIKGTNLGTQTDTNGNFTLKVKNAADVIVVSYIGYYPQEIPVTSLKKKSYQFKLQLSAAMMGEVVITTVVRRPKNVWYRLRGVMGTHSSLVPDENPPSPYY